MDGNWVMQKSRVYSVSINDGAHLNAAVDTWVNDIYSYTNEVFLKNFNAQALEWIFQSFTF